MCACANAHARQADQRDIEDFFRDFGPLANVWVARQPPGFAYVEFDEPRDADDAIKDVLRLGWIGADFEPRQWGTGSSFVSVGDCWRVCFPNSSTARN